MAVIGNPRLAHAAAADDRLHRETFFFFCRLPASTRFSSHIDISIDISIDIDRFRIDGRVRHADGWSSE